MTSNDDPEIIIEEYLKKEIDNFKSNRLGDSPIAKTLRLVEDICKGHINNPILSSTDIFPYGENSEVMIEVFLIPSDVTEFTVIG